MAETVREIIDRIRRIHHQLSWFCETVGDATEKERMRMLLRYISRHEQNLDGALAKYQDGASRAVLNTWFKTTPGPPLGSCVEQVNITADLDADEVIRVVLACDKCLVESFRRFAESAVADEVRDFFQQLIGMEERAEHRLLRDALELEDV